MLKAILGLVTGAVLSLLPVRYRSRFAENDIDVTRGALVGGVAQIILCLAIAFVRYLSYADARVRGSAAMQAGLLKAAESGGETAVQGMGIFFLIDYVFQPLTLLLIYFALEGLVRTMAATVTSEIVPTLPLALLAWGQGKAEARRAERVLGERVVDEVQRPTPGVKWELRILSCRPKEWNQLTTIAFEEELYELAGIQQAPPPRRFAYLLRKKPEHKVVRGIYHYSPEECLPEKERAALAGKVAGG